MSFAFHPKVTRGSCLEMSGREQENVTSRFVGSKLPGSLCVRAHTPAFHMNNNSFLDFSLEKGKHIS